MENQHAQELEERHSRYLRDKQLLLEKHSDDTGSVRETEQRRVNDLAQKHAREVWWELGICKFGT
jgi:hypothetical protein